VEMGYKVRLEPNNKQISKLFQYAGTKRFAYNWALERQEQNYKSGGKFIKHGDLRKEFTQLKKKEEYKWLNNISNNVTKQAIKDACIAYENFFEGLSNFPKFKSRKKSPPKFYQDSFKIQFTSSHVKFEAFSSSRKKNKQKLNWVKLCEKNRIPYGENIKYTNPRVSFDGLNWFISVSVEQENIKPKLNNLSIGIDLGIKDLAVVSNIEKRFKNINKTKKVRKLEMKKKRLQKQVSRKYEMNKSEKVYNKTNNIIKLEPKINKLHKKLSHIRLNYIQEVTTEIVRTKQSRIVVEDLNVKGMMKNKHLSKAIQNQSFYEFQKILAYKANRNGIEFVKADRWYPSSKICSRCGAIKTDLKLSDRVFICPECGMTLNRDKNASINLANYKQSS
jgi:putative transposase